VSRHCWIAAAQGKMVINGPVKTGMIEIGYGDIGIFDRKKSRTIWQVKGEIVFNGKTQIGHGSKINAEQNAYLSIGNNFQITAETSIVCHKKISIGNDCLFSWDVLIMDTDIHRIKNGQGLIINEPKEVIIGNCVWLGCRTLILKGVKMADGNIITANSVITQSIEKENCIIGANPQRILNENITWEV
jgi:acetyltransferase-like isoleucine patch superfamily enzyme